ncbi:MAG: class I SAM-dependent RNA methyltransferase [Caulobacteraceae bacterium]
MRRPRPSRPDPSSPQARDVELSIERVAPQGDGVASGPVYAPFTLPGERVQARAVGDRAELVSVLEASPDRVGPPCPHFGACGGCALQHWAHAPYLAWKVEQIRVMLARERLETEFAAPFAVGPGVRRRLALHARRQGGRTIVGFKARKTWDVVEVNECVIADPRLVAALPALARFATPLFQNPKSAPILHVTWTDDGLDVDVTGVEAKSGGLSADARVKLADAAAEGNFVRASLAGEMLFQARRPTVRFGSVRVALPPGGFLQAVPAAEEAMAVFVMEAVAGADRVADLFCGSGAFTFRLAERASVTALDSSALAVALLREAIAAAPGLKQIDAQARDLDRRPLLAMEMKKLDAVVFDPPRAGAYEQASQIAASGVSRAVGVSCNPATFVRDARVLADAGFRLTRLLPVDQFLWSPHIELVGVFER